MALEPSQSCATSTSNQLRTFYHLKRTTPYPVRSYSHGHYILNCRLYILCTCSLFPFPRVAATNSPKLDTWSRNVLPHGSGDQKWVIQLLPELVLSESFKRVSVPYLSPSSWQVVVNLLCSLPCRCITSVGAMFTRHFPCMHVCFQLSPFYKDISHTGLGAHVTPP